MASRRVVRDVFLRRFRLERSYRPAVLCRHPEWAYEDLLALAVGRALHGRPDFTFLQIGAFDGVANDPIHPLVDAYGLARLDLVQIDAEGYDYQIVRTIDFDVLRPCIIRLEHAHLSAAESRACVELLASHGYRFIAERRDLLALREM